MVILFCISHPDAEKSWHQAVFMFSSIFAFQRAAIYNWFEVEICQKSLQPN